MLTCRSAAGCAAWWMAPCGSCSAWLPLRLSSVCHSGICRWCLWDPQNSHTYKGAGGGGRWGGYFILSKRLRSPSTSMFMNPFLDFKAVTFLWRSAHAVDWPRRWVWTSLWKLLGRPDSEWERCSHTAPRGTEKEQQQWGSVTLQSILMAGSLGETEGTNHRILGKVVVGAPSNGVQLHQVLEIGDFSVHPFLFIYDNKHICLY